jgi:uncharacterized protein (UPF0276 family)
MIETIPKIDGIRPLGAGLGYRDPYRADLFLHREAIDFLEIIADHFMGVAPGRTAQRDLLAAHFPLIPHGLNLSLGSAEGLDTDYVRQITTLVNELQPPYWSEHIAFTHAGGVEIGHLTPLPFTREALDTLCRNIAIVQDHTDVPLILENITHVVDLGGEMTEGQFLSELTARTACGLLLDITNLYTNSVNFGYDLDAFLDQAPLDRVVQLHFTGGHWHDGVLIDSHSRPAPPEVWALMEEVVARAPVKGIILERDEDLPPLAELSAELARARQIGRRCRRWD